MNKEFIKEIKNKKEFSKLPDSIIERVAAETDDVKEARALLRKYFGVFLTNKVLKGKGTSEEILRAHISSKKRDYSEFYKKIFEGVDGSFGSVIDLGAGVNGYSHGYLRDILGDVQYLGIEASGQIVDNLNLFFDGSKFEKCNVVWLDLFEVEKVKELVRNSTKHRIIFMFQLVDALENLERDFSKKFILEIVSELTEEDLIVISLPVESLSGRTNFNVRRKWLIDFLEENFNIEKDFLMKGERILCLRKR